MKRFAKRFINAFCPILPALGDESGWGKLGMFEKLFPIKSLDFAPTLAKVSNVKNTIGAELPQANAA
jgi:hypothetical protein